MTSLFLLAQATAGDTPDIPQISPFPVILALAFTVFIIACLWKVFVKAGQPGWACLVPIYNYYILCKIAGKPGWWLVLLIIPFVNFVIAIIICIALAEKFGKGTGFGIGLALLGIIFFPILAFGDAKYHGAPATA